MLFADGDFQLVVIAMVADFRGESGKQGARPQKNSRISHGASAIQSTWTTGRCPAKFVSSGRSRTKPRMRWPLARKSWRQTLRVKQGVFGDGWSSAGKTRADERQASSASAAGGGSGSQKFVGATPVAGRRRAGTAACP